MKDSWKVSSSGRFLHSRFPLQLPLIYPVSSYCPWKKFPQFPENLVSGNLVMPNEVQGWEGGVLEARAVALGPQSASLARPRYTPSSPQVFVERIRLRTVLLRLKFHT